MFMTALLYKQESDWLAVTLKQQQTVDHMQASSHKPTL